ncbi:Calpain-5 [Lamellibrachia satsuma]|nr:Calpain-5 [Lamellibrachia satsuma]
MEARTDMGLVKGHAYGITAVKRVPLEGTGIFNMFNRDKLSMIRLRNPWGGKEWNGRFSDGSEEWKSIASDSRSKIGLTFEDDGEFWMLFEDFCKFFMNAAVCRVINTSILSLRKTWTEALLNGAWTPGRDGGCINNKDTFLQNPQYAFSVGESTDDVLLSLMQKGGRGENQEKMTIGFTILKVEENRRYRLHHMPQVIKSSTFRNGRSVILRYGLSKGRYCVVPTTFEPKLARPFLLRVYTSAASSAMELKDDEPQPSTLSSILGCLPCFQMPVLLTQVIVVKAVGLEGKRDTSTPDPFCTISCEGEKVKTPVCKDNLNPEWNTGAIFYRAHPTTKQIKISVWNSNMVKDELMGVARIDARNETSNEILELGLTEKNDPGTKRPGTVVVKLLVSSNLQAL